MNQSQNEPKPKGPLQRMTHGITSYLLEYYFTIGLLSYMVGVLIFVTGLLNATVVDDVNDSSLDALLVNTAFLVVIAPLTILLMRRTENEELTNPMRLQQPLRKVIGYFASLVAIVYTIGVLVYAVIAVLYFVYDRDEDISIEYLPTLLVAALLLLGLAKYVGSHKSIAQDKLRLYISRFLPYLFLGVFLLLLVAPLIITRSAAFKDDRRLEDLSDIASEIESHVRVQGSMPDSISELDLDSKLKDRAREDGYSYENTTVSDGVSLENGLTVAGNYQYVSYRLCANLDASGEWKPDGYRYSSASSNDKPLRYGTEYSKGRNCFDYENVRVYTNAGARTEPTIID